MKEPLRRQRENWNNDYNYVERKKCLLHLKRLNKQLVKHVVRVQ